MAVKRGSVGSRPSATGDPSKSTSASSSPLSAEAEVAVCTAFLSFPYGHKPVGPARHFQVAIVYEKLQMAGFRDITPEKIWQYLDSMFDMEALNRMHSEEVEKEKNKEEMEEEEEGGSSGDSAEGSTGEGVDEEEEEDGGNGDLKEFTDFALPKYILQPESVPTPHTRTAKGCAGGSGGGGRGDEASKRPTRSTPGITPNKRRK